MTRSEWDALTPDDQWVYVQALQLANEILEGDRLTREHRDAENGLRKAWNSAGIMGTGKR